MTILKNLVVKNGSYLTRDGQEKNRWLTIGQLHSGQNGNDYVTLDAHINLAALPRKDGDTRVMVSLFDPKVAEDGGSGRGSGGRAQAQVPKQSGKDDGLEFDDDIPF